MELLNVLYDILTFNSVQQTYGIAGMFWCGVTAGLATIIIQKVDAWQQ